MVNCCFILVTCNRNIILEYCSPISIANVTHEWKSSEIIVLKLLQSCFRFDRIKTWLLKQCDYIYSFWYASVCLLHCPQFRITQFRRVFYTSFSKLFESLINVIYILMGTNCAHPLSHVNLYSYKANFITARGF